MESTQTIEAPIMQAREGVSRAKMGVVAFLDDQVVGKRTNAADNTHDPSSSVIVHFSQREGHGDGVSLAYQQAQLLEDGAARIMS